MESDFPTPDDYFNNLPSGRKEPLLKIRSIIKKLLPNAEETMRYEMPTYVIGNKFAALASQKEYMCVYVCNAPVLAKYTEELKHLNCGKGCIRFRRIEELPTDTIKKIIKETFEDEWL